jgi:hypothetical protein
MGVRVSKSFKVAPGVRVRVNAKSTSGSFGGKGVRYTVNSKGRHTTTARIPGTPVSVQQVSGTRRSAAQQRAAPQVRSVAAVSPKPGLFAPRGERRLYKVLARTDLSAADYAARCEKIAAKYPQQRIAALTLAGLFSLTEDPPRAIRTLEAVFASGVEIADDEFLRRYSPKKSFLMPAGGGRKVDVPISRELVAMRLVLVHMVARQFDQAESVAAKLKETPVARELRRQLAAARQNFSQ